MERLIEAVSFHAARLTRRILTGICQRSVTAEVYLLAAGVDVDRLGAEATRKAAAN